MVVTRRFSSFQGETLGDIDKQKKHFPEMFRVIDGLPFHSAHQNQSMIGIVNRASLRAMLKDPWVSIKTKTEIMDNWEDFM